jgi:hypothetical protein
MTYKEIRDKLPVDFDPVRIWDEYQDPGKATPESYYMYAEDGGISVLWIFDDLTQFADLMTAILFKGVIPEGLEAYNVEDSDTLAEFYDLVAMFYRIKSESWDVSKCNHFINNEFDNDLSRYGFCIYELGKVEDLLRINKDQYEYCKKAYKDNFLSPELTGLSTAQFWICKNYRNKKSPSESRDEFLQYLSESLVIN